MLKLYAIRITEANIALIRALNDNFVDIDVTEDQNRYFMFAVDAHNNVVENDVTALGLEGYEDVSETKRIIFQ